MRAHSLVFRIWVATAAVAVASVAGMALIMRTAFRSAFAFYLQHQAATGMRPGGGGPGTRLILSATEQEFQSSVDAGILWGAVAAVLLSFVVSYLLARALARPLAKLTDGAQALAEGDLSHRVVVEGPVEIERLGEAFNEMAASLDEAELLRRRMVADVAHELRNPVAALRAQAEGIAEGVLLPEESRLASLVEDTAHLSRLVDDLHELSVAEAGGLRYDMVSLVPAALVGREVERAAASTGEDVTVRSACEMGSVEIVGDEGRLSQVLRNLLGNAVRHTSAGEVVVSCAVKDGAVTVAVSDTGEGIPEADLPYVFERFYRADSARAQHTGGVGVGLAVAKRIVEDHGGTVFARNGEAGGAVVGFTLPARSSA